MREIASAVIECLQSVARKMNRYHSYGPTRNGLSFRVPSLRFTINKIFSPIFLLKRRFMLGSSNYRPLILSYAKNVFHLIKFSLYFILKIYSFLIIKYNEHFNSNGDFQKPVSLKSVGQNLFLLPIGPSNPRWNFFVF